MSWPDSKSYHGKQGKKPHLSLLIEQTGLMKMATCCCFCFTQSNTQNCFSASVMQVVHHFLSQEVTIVCFACSTKFLSNYTTHDIGGCRCLKTWVCIAPYVSFLSNKHHKCFLNMVA